MLSQKTFWRNIFVLLLGCLSLPVIQATKPRYPILQTIQRPLLHTITHQVRHLTPMLSAVGQLYHVSRRLPYPTLQRKRWYMESITTVHPKHRSNTFRSWGGFSNRRMMLAMLLGTGLGGTTYWLQHQEVTARGYEEGLFSIVAFETTISTFEKERLGWLSSGQLEELYYSATQLLFDVQGKIIQCKALSRSTGYPLYHPEWKAYKGVRRRTERLIQQLCGRNRSLAPIGDMQELEDAFFTKAGGDTFENCFGGFLEGLGRGVLEAPVNVVKCLLGMVIIPINILCELGDDLNGSRETKKRITQYANRVDRFAEIYKGEGLPQEDGQVMQQLVELVLESYNLMWHLNTYKIIYPKFNIKMNRKINQIRTPLFDEFCLKYTRDWLPDRMMKQLAQMTPAERTQCITYLVSTTLASALLLDFVSDIAGLGDLDKLGSKSRVGRWIRKTRGGRATFRQLRKIHQTRNKVIRGLCRRGVNPRNARVVGANLAKGKWIEPKEHMSIASRAYEKHVTGGTRVFKLNGVKFDGMKGGVLLDAKAKHDQFIEKSGLFKGFFTGRRKILKQAKRQVAAAKGAPIEWHFLQRKTCKTCEKLLKKNFDEKIKCVYNPMP